MGHKLKIISGPINVYHFNRYTFRLLVTFMDICIILINVRLDTNHKVILTIIKAQETITAVLKKRR